MLSCQRRWMAFQGSATPVEIPSKHAIERANVQPEERTGSPTLTPPALTLRPAHKNNEPLPIRPDLLGKAEQGNTATATGQSLMSKRKEIVINTEISRILPTASDVQRPILIVDDNQINLKVLKMQRTLCSQTDANHHSRSWPRIWQNSSLHV